MIAPLLLFLFRAKMSENDEANDDPVDCLIMRSQLFRLGFHPSLPPSLLLSLTCILSLSIFDLIFFELLPVCSCLIRYANEEVVALFFPAVLLIGGHC